LKSVFDAKIETPFRFDTTRPAWPTRMSATPRILGGITALLIGPIKGFGCPEPGPSDPPSSQAILAADVAG